MLTIEDLAAILDQHRQPAGARVAEFDLGDVPFPFNSQPALMGVINLSADSWYRESVCVTEEQAVTRGQMLALQGASIIDVGAESSLAHAARASGSEQEARLLPVIQRLAQAGLNVSAETYLASVAQAALAAGARVINLTGPGEAERIYPLVAEHDAAVIICYVQAVNVREARDFQLASDPIPLMLEYFGREIERAKRSGVKKIVIDPGLGFYYRNLQDSAVRVRHQITTFLNTFRLRSLGFPVCHALPHAFEYFGDEVRTAEPVFAVLAALGKTDLFRTHEVSKVKAVLELLRAGAPAGTTSS